MDEALAIYRREFQPSARLAAPYAMLALNVVAADTDAQARHLFTTQQQAFVNLRRGRPGLIPPPIDDIEAFWTPGERLGVERALACAVVGGPETVRQGVAAFITAPSPGRDPGHREHLRPRRAPAFVRAAGRRRRGVQGLSPYTVDPGAPTS